MALPKIKIDLEVDERGFVSGMARAEDGVDDFGKKADRASKSSDRLRKGLNAAKVAAAAAAAGLAAAATASFKLVNATSKQADILVKTADRLGLNVVALQELTFAAERSGVSSETLNMAMQRMTRRVAEAAQGSGEAKDAIAELGLSAQALAEMEPDQQMLVFADALEGVSNQADRVRIAMKLFDSEGVSLLNMLDGGSKAISDYAGTLRELGGVIDEATARDFVKFQDAMTDLRTQFGGLKKEVASELLPVFQDDLIPVISDELIPALQELTPFIRDFLVPTIASLAENTALAVGKFAELYEWMSSMPSAIRGVGQALLDAFNPLGGLMRGGEGIQDFLNGGSGEGEPTRLTVPAGTDTLDERGEMFGPVALPNVGQITGQIDAIREATNEGYGQIEDDLKTHKGNLEKIEEDSAKARKTIVADSVSDIASAFLSGNEKMQRVGAIIQAAQAFASTMAGAAEALKLPFPANIAASAKVVATGMGLVNAIKQSGSSGRAGSGPSGGGGSAGAGAIAAQAPEQASGPAVSLTLIGNNFSDAQVVKMAEAMNDASGNGNQLVDIRGR